MLMDGPLSEELDSAFYKKRSSYIDGLIGKDAEYMSYVRPQLEQLKNLPDKSSVYLWFEHDLFCQVNLWSCLTWMTKYCKEPKLYLVEPPSKDWRGFGWLSEEELSDAFSEAKLLGQADIQTCQEALRLFMVKDRAALELYVRQEGLNETVREAITAELTRLPNAEGEIELHRTIMRLGLEEGWDFSKTFQRFCREQDVYGMGDVQFKFLFEKLLK